MTSLYNGCGNFTINLVYIKGFALLSHISCIYYIHILTHPFFVDLFPVCRLPSLYASTQTHTVKEMHTHHMQTYIHTKSQVHILLKTSCFVILLSVSSDSTSLLLLTHNLYFNFITTHMYTHTWRNILNSMKHMKFQVIILIIVFYMVEYWFYLLSSK